MSEDATKMNKQNVKISEMNLEIAKEEQVKAHQATELAKVNLNNAKTQKVVPKSLAQQLIPAATVKPAEPAVDEKAVADAQKKLGEAQAAEQVANDKVTAEEKKVADAKKDLATAESDEVKALADLEKAKKTQTVIIPDPEKEKTADKTDASFYDKAYNNTKQYWDDWYYGDKEKSGANQLALSCMSVGLGLVTLALQ
jgi:hypothetical protein